MSLHQHAAMLRHNSNSSSNTNSRRSKLLIRSRSAEVQPFMDLSSASSNYLSFSSFSSPPEDDALSLPIVTRSYWGCRATTTTPFKFFLNPLTSIASIFRSFIPAIQSLVVPTCRWVAVTSTAASSLTSPRRRRLTATFFGQKRGRVSFAVQETPRSEPMLLLELAMPTSHLVKEMASGMVRILLECERNANMPKTALLDEPVWTMYCNGHKLGYAVSRGCTASDLHVLGTVQAVSVGAGVMPAPDLMPAALPPPKPTEVVVKSGNDCGSEVMYMRAKFERVIGNRNSEAFYMINPDCSGGEGGGKYNSGGPELSIFLLRI